MTARKPLLQSCRIADALDINFNKPSLFSLHRDNTTDATISDPNELQRAVEDNLILMHHPWGLPKKYHHLLSEAPEDIAHFTEKKYEQDSKLCGKHAFLTVSTLAACPDISMGQLEILKHSIYEYEDKTSVHCDYTNELYFGWNWQEEHPQNPLISVDHAFISLGLVYVDKVQATSGRLRIRPCYHYKRAEMRKALIEVGYPEHLDEAMHVNASIHALKNLHQGELDKWLTAFNQKYNPQD